MVLMALWVLNMIPMVYNNSGNDRKFLCETFYMNRNVRILSGTKKWQNTLSLAFPLVFFGSFPVVLNFDFLFEFCVLNLDGIVEHKKAVWNFWSAVIMVGCGKENNIVEKAGNFSEGIELRVITEEC